MGEVVGMVVPIDLGDDDDEIIAVDDGGVNAAMVLVLEEIANAVARASDGNGRCIISCRRR